MSQQQPLISHLLELRSKLLKSIASVLIVFICSVYWANDIYHYMAIPLMQSLPLGGSMIATDVAAPFFAPFKLTLVLSFFVAVPYVLFQIWSFVAPGLYKHEKRLVMPLLFSSTVLFYLGIAFAYYVVFPVVFGFFCQHCSRGSTSCNRYQQLSWFCTEIIFCIRLILWDPDCRCFTLLGRCDNTWRSQAKTPLYYCRRIRGGYAAHTTWCYFPNYACRANAVIVRRRIICGSFLQ